MDDSGHKGNTGQLLNSRVLGVLKVRVLARPYMMMLYVIFPIHLNFPIRSRCVLKAILYWKNSGLFYGYLRKFFFFKKTLFMILHTCMWYLISFSILSHSVPIFHFLYLSLLYYLNIWKNLIFILPYYFYLFHVYCFI